MGTMTRDEFDALVTSMFSRVVTKGGKSDKRSERWWHGGRNEDDSAGIEIRWRTGGMSGGSCWGDEPTVDTDAEMEPEFEQLDQLLERLCPNMTLWQYKRLMKECVHRSTDTDCGDYGDYSNYAVKRVEFAELYDFLVKEKVIAN